MENNKTTANYGFCDIQELFDYYGTGVIRIADFQLHSQGVLLTHICRNGQGDISFWSGNPEEDSCADEIIMSRAEWKLCCEQVLDMSC